MNLFNKQRKLIQGFSLVELVVVMAVLAILVTLAGPVFTGFVKDAKVTKAVYNAKLLEDAVHRYYTINGDWPRASDETVDMSTLTDYVILNVSGQEVDPEDLSEANLYYISEEEIGSMVKIKGNFDKYLLQNPVGSVYALVAKNAANNGETNININDFVPVITMSPEQGLTTETPVSFSYEDSIIPEGVNLNDVTFEWEGKEDIYSAEGEYIVKLRIGYKGEFTEWVEKGFYVIDMQGIKQISAGVHHTVALLNDGTAVAWGWNGNGQLGDNSTTQSNTPVQVKGIGNSGTLSGIKQISAGEYHSVALLNDSTAVAWGRNDFGQLGDNSTTNRLTPVQVKGIGNSGVLSDIKQISAGTYHTVALLNDGTATAWGHNTYGELGDKSTINRPTPVQVKGIGGSGVLSDIKEISIGEIHTVALLNDGTAVAWGYNESGRLGNNSTTQSNTPVQVKGIGNSGTLSGIKQISAGGNHTVALLNDGTAVAWGNNSCGQLGDNSTTQRNTPVQVKGIGNSGMLSNIKQISAGRNHTVALLNDGTAVAWGANGNGQLGDNSTINKLTPVQVKGIGNSGTLSDIKEISAGGNYTVALLNDGTAVAWGYNYYRQLGDNSITQRNTPVQVIFN